MFIKPIMAADWKREYSVGHPILDEQHRGFFVLCKQAEACRKDRTHEGRQRFHGLLNELVIYANRHFVTEENMLALHEYPWLEQHKAEHEVYHEKLTDFVLQATFGELDRDGLFDYLTEWWTRHILESDMKYRDYVRTSKIS
jgi:hemerythrin